MTVNKLNHRFEQLIDSLSIRDGKKKYLKNQTNYLVNNLKKTSRYTYDYPPNWAYAFNPNELGIDAFWYGGSWDRGVFINKKFDLDIYLIYRELDEIPEGTYYRKGINTNTLKGEEMFQMLYDDLFTMKNKINNKLKILKEPPYTFAIPIILDFQGQSIDFDCIPAFEEGDDYLRVPDGWDYTKKVNQTLEFGGISRVNKKTKGNATKLIWLLKYWNWRNGPTTRLKSYIIQRLVEEIFQKIGLNEWPKALKTFFAHALHLFNRYFKGEKVLLDRVYVGDSILDEYYDKQLRQFYATLKNANKYAVKNQWEALFGNF